jgi:hypothetical protein
MVPGKLLEQGDYKEIQRLVEETVKACIAYMQGK